MRGPALDIRNLTSVPAGQISGPQAEASAQRSIYPHRGPSRLDPSNVRPICTPQLQPLAISSRDGYKLHCIPDGLDPDWFDSARKLGRYQMWLIFTRCSFPGSFAANQNSATRNSPKRNS
jgi:hypothetical protein